MKIHVLFFGVLTDIAPSELRSYEVSSGTSINDLMAKLTATYPDLGPRFDHVAVAQNERITARSSKLAEGDVVAFLPPVSGG